jgi:hypothetical protein
MTTTGRSPRRWPPIRTLCRADHRPELSCERCHALRSPWLSFPRTIPRAPGASGRGCSGLSWSYARMERGRAGRRARTVRPLGCMHAGVGRGTLFRCLTSRCAIWPRRLRVSRRSGGASSTRGSSGRYVRIPRGPRSGWHPQPDVQPSSSGASRTRARRDAFQPELLIQMHRVSPLRPDANLSA